jgi:hypothetical protein
MLLQWCTCVSTTDTSIAFCTTHTHTHTNTQTNIQTDKQTHTHILTHTQSPACQRPTHRVPFCTTNTVVLLLRYSGVITVEFQWCRVVPHWCHSGITVVFQWCYSGVPACPRPTRQLPSAPRGIRTYHGVMVAMSRVTCMVSE